MYVYDCFLYIKERMLLFSRVYYHHASHVSHLSHASSLLLCLFSLMLERMSAVNSSPDSVAATSLSRAGETSMAEMPPKLRPPRVSASFWFPDEEIL